jgi:sugar lactone lactonase YvrE
MKPKVLLECNCLLGEGPIWDSTSNILSWVDIVKGTIHEYSLTSKVHSIIPVNDMVGAIAHCENGAYLAALKEGLAYIDRESYDINFLTNPEKHLPNNRFNDGKCDSSGRFWIGSMSLNEEPNAGALYSLDTSLQVVKEIGEVTISNGMAWTADAKIMYYIDTPTRQVCAFDFNIVTAKLSNKRIVITIPEEEGYPDGMTIDREGKLWIAHWGGWQISRWNPENGKKLKGFKLPVSKITSCTFGGKDLSNLYITSASIDLSSEEMKEQPLAGSVFVIENIGWQGFESSIFKNQ